MCHIKTAERKPHLTLTHGYQMLYSTFLVASPAEKKQAINEIAAFIGTHPLYNPKKWPFKRVFVKLKFGDFDSAYLKMINIKRCLDNLSA